MAALKKSPAKKTSTKKPVAKKATAKKATAKKATAKKATAKKATAKKATAKKATAKKATAKKATAKKPSAPAGAPKRHHVFAMSFARIYPMYVQKAESKGRTRAEVDKVIAWLTGYEGKSLKRVIDTNVDFETFFADAPRMNPNANRITGVVCGVRVEDVADPLMQKIRYLDKLVDELAKGKKMESILRQ